MTDKYLQTFTQMAGEFKDGGGDKGKLFQKALKVAEGMTDEKHKGVFQQAELVVAKVFGSEEEDEAAAAAAATTSSTTHRTKRQHQNHRRKRNLLPENPPI